MDDEEENTKKNSSNRKPISYSTEFRLDINLTYFVRKLYPRLNSSLNSVEYEIGFRFEGFFFSFFFFIIHLLPKLNRLHLRLMDDDRPCF